MVGHRVNMKQIIRNPKLLKILSLIETRLGYPIGCYQIPKEDMDTRRAEVVRREGKWLFGFGDNCTEASVCHELMHIVLDIQGWPAYHAEKVEDGDIRHLLTILGTLGQHLYVWKYMKSLGFEDHRGYFEFNKACLAELDNDVQKAHANENYLKRLTVEWAHGQSMPCHIDIRERCYEEFSNALPDAAQMARGIRDLFGGFCPIRPCKIPEATARSLKMLGLDPELITYTFPEVGDSGFFQRIFFELVGQK